MFAYVGAVTEHDELKYATDYAVRFFGAGERHGEKASPDLVIQTPESPTGTGISVVAHAPAWAIRMPGWKPTRRLLINADAGSPSKPISRCS